MSASQNVGEPVEPAIPKRAGCDPQHKAHGARDDPRRRQKQRGAREPLAHHLDNRLVEAKALAKISLHGVAQPREIAFNDGRVGVPPLRQLFPALRAHRCVCRLSHIGLHGIDG